MVAQFVFRTLRLMQREHDHEYQQELFRDADVLWFGEKAKGFFATFAADAACLHAAEGDAQVAHDGNRARRFHF